MKALMRSITILIGWIGLVAAAQASSNFDDLTLAPNSNFSSPTSVPFTSGNATYQYTFNDYGGGCCSSDWTYSNRTDTTTAGFTNQFSAITGGGQGGSANYGVAFVGGANVSLAFSVPTVVQSAYFTNTTYAALSMRDGDSFAKKFTASDFFKLTITGINNLGASTGSMDFFLASQGNIVTTWQQVGLTTLGTVSQLQFSLTSSDVGPFGMNTPAYFAMDTLTTTAPVPEPHESAMLLAGLAFMALRLRRRTRDA